MFKYLAIIYIMRHIPITFNTLKPNSSSTPNSIMTIAISSVTASITFLPASSITSPTTISPSPVRLPAHWVTPFTRLC